MAHLAFLGHSHRSHADVLKIARVLHAQGVNYWLDEEQIKLGDNILAKMEDGLNRATVVVAFVGSEGVDGKWQDLEIQAALHQSISRNKKVIPVLLPGAGHSASLPLFLQGLLYVNLRSTDDSEELQKLVKAIRDSSPPPPGEKGAEKTPAATDVSAYQGLLESLVYDANDLNINFLIGPAAWTSTRDLRLQVSSQLVGQMVGAGLPQSLTNSPVEVAALYFALFKKKEDAPARELISIIGGRAASKEDAAARLAAVLGNVRRRRPGQIQVVLTTNQDLTIERALLQAALPFTRMVRDVRKRLLIVEAYQFPEDEKGFPEPGGVYTKGAGGRAVPRPDSPTEADRLINEAAGREIWCASQPDPRSFTKEQVKGLVPAFEFDARPLLVLYKFKGSVDIRGSCLIAADDLYDCATVEGQALIPRQINSSILENMSVLLGYYPGDIDLRLLHRTLLRDLPRGRGNPPKYAVSPVPVRAGSLEEDLREALGREMQDWLEGQGFQTAHNDVAEFLTDLAGKLPTT